MRRMTEYCWPGVMRHNTEHGAYNKERKISEHCVKKERWGIMIAFLGGIVFANLLGKELLATYGVLNDYYLSRYLTHAASGNRLFCYVLIERGKMALLIFLLGRALSGRIFSGLLKGMISAGFGFLMVVAIVNLGVRGIAVSVCGLLPQWGFYLAALFCYTWGSGSDESSWRKRVRVRDTSVCIVRGICTVLLLLLGVAAESYVSPVLLGYILKKF